MYVDALIVANFLKSKSFVNEPGKGQNYEFHYVENQKEHRKSWRRSLHRKDL